MTRDWNELERWDRAYYLHGLQAEDELSITAVDSTDGNYLTLADGTRLLDFMSQLISDNLGHRHPAIHGALAEAMERYGHVTYTMANEYRARAAKLVIADILGQEGWAGRLRILPSGTEAVDSCIMMARLYTGRSVILTQAHSFHGMTVGPTMMRGYRNNISTEGGFADVADVPGFPPHGYIPIRRPSTRTGRGRGLCPRSRRRSISSARWGLRTSPPSSASPCSAPAAHFRTWTICRGSARSATSTASSGSTTR